MEHMITAGRGSVRFVALAVGLVTVALSAAVAWQMPWRQYRGQDNIELPPDYQEKTEWQFARLMYPQYNGGYGGGFRGFYGRRQSWSTDYDSADRHVARALRRLTRIHVRSVEQPVNLDEGDQYDWPFLYAVEVGHWKLTNLTSGRIRRTAAALIRGRSSS